MCRMEHNRLVELPVCLGYLSGSVSSCSVQNALMLHENYPDARDATTHTSLPSIPPVPPSLDAKIQEWIENGCKDVMRHAVLECLALFGRHEELLKHDHEHKNNEEEEEIVEVEEEGQERQQRVTQGRSSMEQTEKEDKLEKLVVFEQEPGGDDDDDGAFFGVPEGHWGGGEGREEIQGLMQSRDGDNFTFKSSLISDTPYSLAATMT